LTWGAAVSLLVKVGTEAGAGTGGYFASKENATVADRPYLEITYTPSASTTIPIFMNQYKQRWN